MYSSNQHDYDKFPAYPATSAPPPFVQPPPAAGIPMSSAGQYQNVNVQVLTPQIQAPNNFQPRVERPWSTGLCDCGTDCTNCCITCWCPCITYGQISEILDKGSSSCVANGTIYALITWFTGCGCLLSCCYRSKMRRQFMLQENPCGDCCVHFCCELCALCQEYRELKSRGFDMALGWQGNVERQNGGVAMPPVIQGGMTR